MLKVYTIDNAEQWDGVVRSFQEYDVYWLSGYVKAFKLHGDGEPMLFYYKDDDIRGINVVMRRDVAKDENFVGRISEGRYYDFSTPYGYGGWLIEGVNSTNLFTEYKDWLLENHIICEFVRFHPVIGNHKFSDEFYDVIELGKVVHMELGSKEDIWSNFTSKNRNVIRKAMKNDIKIYNGRFPEIFMKFREIYDLTMEKDRAEDYYFFSSDFYESILHDLSENAQVFWAEKDGKVIAASIMLMANCRMNYHLSGSLKEYSMFAPTNLLLYKAAVWGAENNFKTLYLGGGVGSGEDSLFKFKRAFFRGDLRRFYIGKQIYDNDMYNELVGIRRKVESNYFPEYRAKY